MPAHQVFSLTAYIFETSYSTSDTHANKSMDQSELLNLWAGIGTLTCCLTDWQRLQRGRKNNLPEENVAQVSSKQNEYQVSFI